MTNNRQIVVKNPVYNGGYARANRSAMGVLLVDGCAVG